MNKHSWLAAILVTTLSGVASASSHREAPAISKDPAADNTDLYAWVNAGTHDKLNIVAAYNPLEEPAGGPNFNEFSDDVLYTIYLAKGASKRSTIRYEIRFHKTPIARVKPDDQNAPPGGGKEFFVQLSGQQQTYTVTRYEDGKAAVKIAENVPVAPPRIGPFTYANFQKPAGGPASYDDTFAASFVRPTSEGGRVWAGPRDDGFYVDLGGVFDAAQLRAKGQAQDGVAGFNVHAIALEIPTAALLGHAPPTGNNPANASNDNLVGVWAAASRPIVEIRLNDGNTVGFGGWQQVSRLGLPLVNEALIGLQDKDRWNATRPYYDVAYFGAYFLNPVIVRDAEAVGIYQALGVDPTPFKFNRLDIIDTINLKASGHSIPLGETGDFLRVDLGLDSSFPNGRSLVGGAQPNMEQADVTDVLLSVLLAKGMLAIKDNVDYNDKPFLSDLPWLALPWQGADQGHGKPTP
jgi:hypothetical protein